MYLFICFYILNDRIVESSQKKQKNIEEQAKVWKNPKENLPRSRITSLIHMDQPLSSHWPAGRWVVAASLPLSTRSLSFLVENTTKKQLNTSINSNVKYHNHSTKTHTQKKPHHKQKVQKDYPFHKLLHCWHVCLLLTGLAWLRGCELCVLVSLWTKLSLQPLLTRSAAQSCELWATK